MAAKSITAKIQVITDDALMIWWDTSNPRQALQSTIDPAEGWSDIPGATRSPHIVSPTGPHRFIRVIQRKNC